MKKLKSLYADTRNVLSHDANIFEQEQFARKHQTTSENGSLKYTTTGNPFLDDFAKLSLYKEKRDLSDIFETMDNLWANDPLSTLQLTVFLRLITRKTVLFTGETLPTQRGQGLKHEFLGRMLWLGNRHNYILCKNLEIFIAAGSWKDIFDLLRYDLSYNGISGKMLDWYTIIFYIKKYLGNPGQSELIKKYLPQIVSNPSTLQEECNSYIGKKIARSLFGEPKDNKEKGNIYKMYRKLKSSGTAHSWQQVISRHEYNLLDFGSIAGRALHKLVNSKFLQNHNLEEVFGNWLLNQNTAKYTGYPYELFKDPDTGYSHVSLDPSKIYPKRYQRELINKQFLQLVETAANDMNRQTGFIVAMDVSGSMTSKVRGSETMSAYSVARAMALYFSYLLKGTFANTFLAFSDVVTICKFEGSGPLEKYYKNYRQYDACNTNFFQIAQLFVRLKNKGYKESDFPTGVIVISDGEFDRQTGDWNTTGISDWRYRGKDSKETVFEAFKNHLKNNGFSEDYVNNFKMVLWDIPNNYYGSTPKPKFEALASTPNIFHLSGFDPAGIAFITGTSSVVSVPRTPEELFEAAMQQELIQRLQL